MSDIVNDQAPLSPSTGSKPEGTMSNFRQLYSQISARSAGKDSAEITMSPSGVCLSRTSSIPTNPLPFSRQTSRLSRVGSRASHAGRLPSKTGSNVSRTSSSGTSAISRQSVSRSASGSQTRKRMVSNSEYHHNIKEDLRSGYNRNLVFTTFIVVFGTSFQFGYNIGVLNQPVELIQSFYNETYHTRYGGVADTSVTVLWSLTTAIFIPGGMLGSFLGGWLADIAGRKKTIMFSQIFSILGAVLSCACVAAAAPEMLMVGRVLAGINSGLGSCIAPMFLSEIAPFNIRGALSTIHQLSITIGILVASVLGIPEILGRPHLWPYLLLLQVIPAITSLIFLPFLPETPRYLLLVVDKKELAKTSLYFYRNSKNVDADLEEMGTEFQQQHPKVEVHAEPDYDKESKKPNEPIHQMTFGELFRSPDLRRPLIVGCMLQVIQQFSGINAVFFYSTGIFTNAGIPKTAIPYAVIGTNAVNVLMTVIAVRLMDKAGRRILLLVPMLVMVVDLIILTIALSPQFKNSWLSYVSIFAVVVYVICFAVGLGPIPMMLTGELFRQGPRPKAMAVAGVVNWICTFIIAMTFEVIQKSAENYTFLIFCVLLIVFIVFTYFCVPETKNKTFEEIAHKYSPGGQLEVEEIENDVFEPLPEGNEIEDPDLSLVTYTVPETTPPTSSDVGYESSFDALDSDGRVELKAINIRKDL